jgi:O-methyltransferase involved in polyketide biosynthesis
MTVIDGNTLEGVSATTPWTLHSRATEAKRSDGVIRDPRAVTLLDTIDYDYLKFGKPNQSHGLRAGVADDVTWYSIDLPPVMELRRRQLPRDDRIVELAQSALDRRWMDRVDSSHGTFITADGLLMYLEPEDALSLIRDCAARFPGGQMMFDSIPRFFSQRTPKGFKLSDRYIAPPMPFSLSAHEGLAMAGTIPGVRVARDVPLAPGRGIWRFMSWKPLDRIGFVRRNRPSMTLLEFG